MLAGSCPTAGSLGREWDQAAMSRVRLLLTLIVPSRSSVSESKRNGCARFHGTRILEETSQVF